MKTKKFGLEQFQVSKLNNKSKIFGGGDEGGDTKPTIGSTTRPREEEEDGE